MQNEERKDLAKALEDMSSDLVKALEHIQKAVEAALAYQKKHGNPTH